MILNWISVEDRLPDKNGKYIVYAQDENSERGAGLWYRNIVVTATYYFGAWLWFEENEAHDEYEINEIVTHWMPLPDSPRMEGENEHIVCQI